MDDLDIIKKHTHSNYINTTRSKLKEIELFNVFTNSTDFNNKGKFINNRTYNSYMYSSSE